MKTKDYLLEHMNWPTVKEKIEDGMDTVIICTASVEQHGFHLSELTDTVIGQAVALLVAEKLGNALVAPVIRPGLSEHHIPMAGSLTLRPEVYRGIIEDYVTSYKKHGFKKVIIFSSHGGNFNENEKIVQNLKEMHPEMQFSSALSLMQLMDLMAQFEKKFGLVEGSCGHGGAMETSVMLHIAPDQVDMTKATPGYIGPMTGDVLNKLFNNGIVGITEVGILGDPIKAKAEWGEYFLELFSDEIVKAVHKDFN
ncbi:MAG TPA: creatininase family protein [Bacillus sp. (in: firmicutes)]|uniref:creatininase family protein n=1 Tax=Bacillus litorisediminis TaxID=2922713 RepID=UPI001FAE8F6A|nr:creatininase family protein [Bacillus litorisediminis]HWO75272.1 creatininase family protein [Bacillus sp. (in: firmicutes)]